VAARVFMCRRTLCLLTLMQHRMGLSPAPAASACAARRQKHRSLCSCAKATRCACAETCVGGLRFRFLRNERWGGGFRSGGVSIGACAAAQKQPAARAQKPVSVSLGSGLCVMNKGGACPAALAQATRCACGSTTPSCTSFVDVLLRMMNHWLAWGQG
jgi:hypothetical protein